MLFQPEACSEEWEPTRGVFQIPAHERGGDVLLDVDPDVSVVEHHGDFFQITHLHQL